MVMRTEQQLNVPVCTISFTEGEVGSVKLV